MTTGRNMVTDGLATPGHEMSLDGGHKTGRRATPILAKMPTCAGCVYEHKGVGFCPDDVKPSDVAILTLLPSMDDVKGRQIVGYAGKGQPLYENTTPKPMIGSAGWLLTNTYLPLAGLNRENTSFHNLIKCHYPGLYKRNKNGQKTIANKKEYEQALEHCTSRHLVLGDRTRFVVAQGQEVWDYTQGKGQSIQDWRGFQGSIKVKVGKDGKVY
jgi:uracil-DNA glycosylase